MKEEMQFTHKQLETAGARWLAKGGYWWSCKRIAIEPASPVSERPDVVGFAHGTSHVIECKTSRADFLRDFKNPGDRPMGAFRWWLCEEGLITWDDLAGCGDGLLWITAGGDIKVIRYPAQRAKEERNMVAEFYILCTLLDKEAGATADRLGGLRRRRCDLSGGGDNLRKGANAPNSHGNATLVDLRPPSGQLTLRGAKATDDAKNSQIRRLYLSAPISALQPEEARRLFDHLAEEVRTTTDWVPVNPYDNGLPPEADWGEHMIRDLQLLRECDAVLMPCDISRSPGCRIEQIFARRLGLYIYTSLEELRRDAF